MHELDLAGTRNWEGKGETAGDLSPPGAAFLGLSGFYDKLVETELQPFFVKGEIEFQFQIQGLTASGRDEMEGKEGKNMQFAPVEVAVG
jgi:hypothetical protein